MQKTRSHLHGLRQKLLRLPRLWRMKTWSTMFYSKGMLLIIKLTHFLVLIYVRLHKKLCYAYVMSRFRELRQHMKKTEYWRRIQLFCREITESHPLRSIMAISSQRDPKWKKRKKTYPSAKKKKIAEGNFFFKQNGIFRRVV